MHHQHEVVVEIAKFLVPVLCRGPNRRTSEFPIGLVKRKLELAQWYLNVVTVVDPGYSKQRVKILYEVVETKLFLAFQELTDTRKIRQIVGKAKEDLIDIIAVFQILVPDKGFESMIFQASTVLVKYCKLILDQIKSDDLQIDKWKDGAWSLLELCQKSMN